MTARQQDRAWMFLNYEEVVKVSRRRRRRFEYLRRLRARNRGIAWPHKKP